MSRNKGFILSSRAQDDLEAIWDYTAQRWGVDQAERYIRDIQDAVLGLVAGTRPSQSIDDIRPGYRKALVGSHLLLFRGEDTGAVNVIRILHTRMDTERHL